MRREALYLNDIVQAADAIASFIAGVQREAFRSWAMIYCVAPFSTS